jgi:O-antigen ligase
MSSATATLAISLRPRSYWTRDRVELVLQWGGLLLLVVWFSYVPDIYRLRGLLLGVEALLAVGIVFARHHGRAAGFFDRSLICMLMFAVAIGLSFLGAQAPDRTAGELTSYLRDVLAVFVLLNLVTTLAGLRLAVWCLIATTVALALLAVVGALLGNPLLGFAAVNVGQIAGTQRGVRVAGVVGNANDFADMLMVALPLALIRAFDERTSLVRLVALLSVLVLAPALVLTYSRAGGIAFVVVLGMLAVRRWRSSPRGVIVTTLAGGCVLAVGVAVPNLYVQRFDALAEYGAGDSSDLSRADGSLHERAQLWQVAVMVLSEHPLVGVGKGDYLLVFPAYAEQIAPNLVNRPLQAHITLLQVAAETGFTGLAALTAILVATVFGLREARRRFATVGEFGGVGVAESIELALYAHLTVSLFISDDRPRFLWAVVALAMIARQLSRRSAGDLA